MNDQLPSEITVRRVMTGVAYDLPARNLGALRTVALFMVVFGIGFACAAPAMALPGVLGGSPRNTSSMAFAAVALAFFPVGAAVAMLGLAMLVGRTSIVVRPGMLVAVERLGPLKWRRRRPSAGLRRLQVHRAIALVNGREFGLFAGRDEDELRWIAWTLRRRLWAQSPQEPG